MVARSGVIWTLMDETNIAISIATVKISDGTAAVVLVVIRQLKKAKIQSFNYYYTCFALSFELITIDAIKVLSVHQ